MTGTRSAAPRLRMRILIVVIAAALWAPAPIGQSGVADTWREFPTYDSLIAARLRDGAEVKNAARLLAQAPTSFDTLMTLARLGRRAEALPALQRVLDGRDDGQLITALHAFTEEM